MGCGAFGGDLGKKKGEIFSVIGRVANVYMQKHLFCCRLSFTGWGMSDSPVYMMGPWGGQAVHV